MHGGKMIAYSGSADPCVPFPDAQGYYERVVTEMGGYEKTASFFRYFLFPGRDHGQNGMGANREWGDEEGTVSLLDVLRVWCETGSAPEYLVGARVEKEQVRFTRKLYPYGSVQNPFMPGMKICEIGIE